MGYKTEDFIKFIEQGRFDKISNSGLKLIAKRFRELEKVVKNITYEPLLETVKCDCALSGSCVYEQMIISSKEDCRHKV